MLTTIPLLAAVFALLTGHHLAGLWHKIHGAPLREEMSAMEQRLREHVTGEHAADRKHQQEAALAAPQETIAPPKPRAPRKPRQQEGTP
jgi:hypothetical protein